MPLRQHLETVWKQTGRKPQQLADCPPIPESLEYLWGWYWEIVTPPERFTFAELSAWCALTGRDLRPWEVDALRAIDRIRHRVANE